MNAIPPEIASLKFQKVKILVVVLTMYVTLSLAERSQLALVSGHSNATEAHL